MLRFFVREVIQMRFVQVDRADLSVLDSPGLRAPLKDSRPEASFGYWPFVGQPILAARRLSGGVGRPEAGRGPEAWPEARPTSDFHLLAALLMRTAGQIFTGAESR